MDIDYHTMRAFADSWGMLFMAAFFLAVVLWVLRPAARKSAEDAASIPFKEQ